MSLFQPYDVSLYLTRNPRLLSDSHQSLPYFPSAFIIILINNYSTLSDGYKKSVCSHFPSNNHPLQIHIQMTPIINETPL